MFLSTPHTILLTALIGHVFIAKAQRSYRFQDLLPCPLSSLEMSDLQSHDVLEPCILYNVSPIDIENSTSVIPLVQVTPSNCANHRDGAFAAVQIMNEAGVQIGFQEDHTVMFSLTSVVAGNPAALTVEEYELRHEQLLRVLLDTTGAPYIIGTCSFFAEVEKLPAAHYEAILMAQVGPPGFYKPENSNLYVFGFHINSDDYSLPNVQELSFLGNKSTPVRVIYRSQSEFFFSTCKSALNRLQSDGFTDVKAFLYDPAVDQDSDGEVNEFDTDFLESIADDACPPDQAGVENPALFLCTLTEHDVMIRRWLKTGCRPQSLWVTAATWSWADDHPDLRPFFQGGGQWHAHFDYSDPYFDSGQALLDTNQAIFGYLGNYDQLVSYAIPVMVSQHLQAAYRVTDIPQPLLDFSDPDGREILRRAMLVLTVDTIFGPVAFNEDQRNIGRGAAGTQWLLDNSAEGGSVNRLVSPSLQAEASTVIPAASALSCGAGSYVNASSWAEGGSLLAGGCEFCPVDSFTRQPTRAFQCEICPNSNTNGLIGSDKCYVHNDNLLSRWILALGYVMTSLSWLLALGFLAWLFTNRTDPVVKVSQVEFLVLICLGAIVSSSSVIALSLQAGTDENTSTASAGCIAAPFLYTIGWTLQYSSLSAKTYRLFQTMISAKRMRGVTVTAIQTIPIVIVCVLIDLIIVLVWTMKSPLKYKRIEESRVLDEELGIVTINSVGRCESDGTFWYYAGPIIGFHFLLVISTNLLLFHVRDIADRYQEQKYVAMASALMFEILLVGIPVLVSVRSNGSATFVVLTAVIALDDICVLCCIFIPKVRFQRKGIEHGVHFGETILRDQHRRASLREFSRREMSSMLGSRTETRSEEKVREFEIDAIQSNSINGVNNESVHQDMLGVDRRRDIFSNRSTGSERSTGVIPPTRFTSSSFTDASIVEETSAESRLELASDDPSGDSGNVVSSDASRQESHSVVNIQTLRWDGSVSDGSSNTLR